MKIETKTFSDYIASLFVMDSRIQWSAVIKGLRRLGFLNKDIRIIIHKYPLRTLILYAC